MRKSQYRPLCGKSHGGFLPAPTAGPVHAVICDMSPLRVPRAWVAGACWAMLGSWDQSHGQDQGRVPAEELLTITVPLINLSQLLTVVYQVFFDIFTINYFKLEESI